MRTGSPKKIVVRMQPAAISLNYSIENIRNNVHQKIIIGISVSKPHASLFNCDFSYMYILGECSALWGEPERVAGCISVS